MEHLLVNSLRMRPDRILVGEVRRKKEIETLFEAIHTGHSCYATIHANDSEETINRLLNKPFEVPKTMLPAVSMIISQFRNRRTGKRRTFQISEINKDGTITILRQYDPLTDKLKVSTKSKTIFSLFKLFSGLNENQINKQIKEKEDILKYLVKKKINTVDAVGKIIAEYYTNSQDLIKKIKKRWTFIKIFKKISKKFPELKEKLIKAQIKDTPEKFIKKVLTISFMGSFSFSFLFILPLLHSLEKSTIFPIFLFIILYFILFSYFLKIPDYKILQIKKNITKELIFAMRFLIIELESGILIYKSFENIRKNYPTIGKYFGDVSDMVNYGTNIDEALNNVVNKCPSEQLRMVFVQIQNSLKTGSDIVAALNSTIEQFTREQQILVNDYSKKLNPVAMFYMIIAVIFPSIGFMILVVITSFIGFQLDLSLLFVIVAFIGFIQFMFISMIKTMRPPVDF